MTNSQSVPEQQGQNPKMANLQNSWKSWSSWTKEDSNSWKQESAESFLPPGQPHSGAERDAHGVEYFHWAAWLAGCAPSRLLLLSWIWETGKSPWFHSNNWKHQCYQHSSPTESKTQQLLWGKVTLCQLKPGQGHWNTGWRRLSGVCRWSVMALQQHAALQLLLCGWRWQRTEGWSGFGRIQGWFACKTRVDL